MGRRQKHRRFSPEFKAEAVRLVRETDTSLSEIARELGVSRYQSPEVRGRRAAAAADATDRR